MSHLATGSAFGRFLACRAYSVLPRAWPASSPDAESGVAVHAHLERLANGVSLEDSLAQAPDEYREACAAVDVEALADDLELAPEVTLAYHPGTDTARVVGQGLDRDYSSVSDDELPMTLDLVGVDQVARRGKVKDYKSGGGAAYNVPPAAENWQIKGGSLALARAYDLDEVDGELLFTAGGRLRRDRAVFGAADLLLASAEMREGFERALRDREAFARGEHIEPTTGPHCRYCPCAWACPARVGLVRAVLGGELTGAAPVAPEDAAHLWPRVNDALAQLEALREQLADLLRRAPVLLATGDDGAQTWIGEVVEPGDEILDATIAIEAAVTVLGTDFDATRDGLATLKVTKKKLGEFIRDQVPKGSGASYERRVLQEIRDQGGTHRRPTRSITTFTVRPVAGED